MRKVVTARRHSSLYSFSCFLPQWKTSGGEKWFANCSNGARPSHANPFYTLYCEKRKRSGVTRRFRSVYVRETGNSRRTNPALRAPHGPNALNASQAKSQSPQEAAAIPPSARAAVPKRAKAFRPSGHWYFIVFFFNRRCAYSMIWGYQLFTAEKTLYLPFIDTYSFPNELFFLLNTENMV